MSSHNIRSMLPLIALSTIVIGIGVLARDILKDKSSSLPVLKQFDINKYTGRFYEAYSTPVVKNTFERNGVCICADYTLLPSGSVSVLNQMRLRSSTGQFKSIRGVASPDGSGILGHFEVRLGKMPFPGAYWIIHTGPENASGQYSYAIVTEPRKLLAWVLVRDLDDYHHNHDANVQILLKQLGFDRLWNTLSKSDHTGCVYEAEDSELTKQKDE